MKGSGDERRGKVEDWKIICNFVKLYFSKGKAWRQQERPGL